MSLSSGTRLGAYEILWRIGTGGMGEMYLAQDAGLHELCSARQLGEGILAE